MLWGSQGLGIDANHYKSFVHDPGYGVHATTRDGMPSLEILT